MSTNLFGLNDIGPEQRIQDSFLVPFSDDFSNGKYPFPGEAITVGIFGTNAMEYAIPVCRIEFINNKGTVLSETAPTLYIRMSAPHQSTLVNNYGETSVFGAGRIASDGDDAATSFLSDFGDVLASLASSGFEGLQKQILSGIAGGAGFVASAGVSGKPQVEFLARKMINNFQQLIYQGPTFRNFNLTFNMKPVSPDEAQKTAAVVNAFRVASSPQTDQDGGLGIDFSAIQGLPAFINSLAAIEAFALAYQQWRDTEQDRPATLVVQGGKEGGYTDAEAQQILQLTSEYIGQGFAEAERDAGSPLLFIYPDMCRFSIHLFVKDSAGDGGFRITKPLFESAQCMIASVTADYGSSSRMAFFKDTTGADAYYPIETNLNIQLRESVLMTAARINKEFALKHTLA